MFTLMNLVQVNHTSVIDGSFIISRFIESRIGLNQEMILLLDKNNQTLLKAERISIGDKV